MKGTKTQNRDSAGDLIIPKPSKKEEKLSIVLDHTYHFQLRYVDIETKNASFFPVVDEYDETEFWAFPKLKIKVHQIFKPLKHPFKQEKFKKLVELERMYEHWLNKYFSEVLLPCPYEIRLQQTRLVMADYTFHEINKVIKEYNLSAHSDFIFLLISYIQKIYLTEVEFYEDPKEIILTKNYPKQVEKLINAVELTDNKNWDWKKGTPPQLEKVIFKYKFHKPKSFILVDPGLVYSIPAAVKEYYGNGSFKNWKRQLENSPKVYSENQKNSNFRYRLAKALHNFFIQEGLFALKADCKIRFKLTTLAGLT